MTLPSHGCPCGSEIAPGGSPYEWITRTGLAIIWDVPEIGVILAPFLAFLYDTKIDIRLLCSAPPPTMPTFTLADFDLPQLVLVKLAQAYAARLWAQRCVCTDCPPVTGCGGGTCYTLTHANGFARPEPTQTQYQLPVGTDVWVGVPGGTCFGLWNGVIIDWTADYLGDWSTGAWTIANGNDSGGVNHRWDAVGEALQVCLGGPVGPPYVPPISLPPGLPAGPDPDACDPTTLCSTLLFNDISIVSQTGVQNQTSDWVRQVLSLVASNVLGYSFDLPGLPSIAGSLVNALPRAIAALAPVTPAQLVHLSTTAVTDTGDLALTGVSAVEIHPVFDSRIFGGYDVNTPAFFTSFRAPGPGWIVFMSDFGVVQRVTINEQMGQMVLVPALATSLRYTLNAGVELNVTFHGRVV